VSTATKLYFSHDSPANRVVFGAGRARHELTAEVDALGGSRVLLITTTRGAGIAGELARELGDRVAGVFTDVRPHVPVEVAEAVRATVADLDVDLLLSIGGGSTTGTAKAAALTTGLPIVAIPTTYAGSEVTPVWGMTEANRKTTGRDVRVLPRTVIYDPDLTLSLPAELSIASGCNALAHAVEAFWAPGTDPVAAALAERGIRALADGLPGIAIDPSDVTAREHALLGAWLAGASFAIAGSGLHHRICHVLGGAYGLAHARTHTIILPHVLAFNASAAEDAARRIAVALGADGAIEGLVGLMEKLDAPSALRDIGLREDQLEEAIDLVAGNVPPDNPRPMDRDDVATLLRAAWRGRGPLAGPGDGVGRPGRPETTGPTARTDAAGPGEVAADQAAREQAVTDAVISRLAGTPSPRLRTVLESLVRHLHGFAREIRLTEREWETGIGYLTRVGHITHAERQEFILLSDVLGLSMLTIGINHPVDGEVTESTVFGPFFVDDTPHVELGGDVARGATGRPAHVSGTVRSEDGTPVPGARIEVWEADDEGFYDVQRDGDATMGRAHLFTGSDGGYRFWCVEPAPYPIPDDGPVGELLRATDRSPMRPAHLHLMVSAPGLRTLITHVFVGGSEHLDDDAVFGVKASLVIDFEQQPPGAGPDGRELDEPWSRARFDLVLATER
jgi:maleylacetate reductase